MGEPHAATMHARWIGGKSGYTYDVMVGSERIVSGSRDPEHDLARALLARRVTGNVELVAGLTGKPRTRFDIEALAPFTIVEREAGGLRRERWRAYAAVEHGTAVSRLGGMRLPAKADAALREIPLSALVAAGALL